jgi:hypothetical protein
VTDARETRASLIAAAGALGFHILNGDCAALMDRFPSSLDELQHLSFIRAMAARPRVLPDYDALRVLAGPAGGFTATPNYLNHPSPDYLLMAPIDRLVGGSILGLRLANLSLSLAAVAILLAAGFQVLKGWRERAVFAGALVLFPKLGAVAGLINNDNAAFLAVAVAVLGLVAWQRAPSRRSAILLALGVALCGWTKLTVLLMIGFSVAIGEALRLWRARKLADLAAYAILAAGLAVAAIPSLANLAAYGRVLHHSDVFTVPVAQRPHLGLARYTALFLGYMAEKWAALEPTDLVQRLGLFLTLGLAAVAVRIGLRDAPPAERDDDEAAGWRTACAMILATLPVLLIHLYFGWKTFQEDGFLEMAQMRYYYGLWPGFALGLGLLWLRFPWPTLRRPATLITGALLASASFGFWAVITLLRGQTQIG